MSILTRASTVRLPASEIARLERMLASDTERIAAALRAEEFDGPVCAIALTYVCEHDLPVASHVSAWSAAERERALAEAAERAGWILWSGADWPHVDFVEPPDEALYREAEQLAAALLRADCEDPEGAYVAELAYRLSRNDWTGVIETSDDFACWATEHELTHETLEAFRILAPSAAVAAYEHRGWMRFPNDIDPDTSEYLQSTLPGPDDRYGALRAEAVDQEAIPYLAISQDSSLAYLSILHGATIVERMDVATEQDDLNIALDIDRNGHLIGVATDDASRRLAPTLVGGHDIAVRRPNGRRSGLYLVLGNTAVADTATYSEDVLGEHWTNLDLDADGRLVGVWFDETSSIPPPLRSRL